MEEKTINVNLSTTMAGKMLHEKIKASSGFALFVAEVLDNTYRLDYVIECLMSGIPNPKWAIGAKLNCIYGDLGECKVISFFREKKYSQYTIEYTDTEGNICETEVNEYHLESIKPKEVVISKPIISQKKV